jgi:hypothetical protein
MIAGPEAQRKKNMISLAITRAELPPYKTLAPVFTGVTTFYEIASLCQLVHSLSQGQERGSRKNGTVFLPSRLTRNRQVPKLMLYESGFVPQSAGAALLEGRSWLRAVRSR